MGWRWSHCWANLLLMEVLKKRGKVRDYKKKGNPWNSSDTSGPGKKPGHFFFDSLP